jgi:hypothetical protein
MNRRLANVVASGGWQWEGEKTGGAAKSTTKSGHTEAKAEHTKTPNIQSIVHKTPQNTQ